MYLLALLVSADMREGFSSLALPAPTAPRSCFPSPFPIEQKARMPVLISHSGFSSPVRSFYYAGELPCSSKLVAGALPTAHTRPNATCGVGL